MQIQRRRGLEVRPGRHFLAARPGPRAARGFTLIELLVALGIFVTVMGSVTLLFTAAVRSSKQGFQNQEAFEVARGALDIIERDINRSFTSRDHGDLHNFYGTPIGFTFIGLISADESSAPNLARTTYVIYHDPNEPNQGSLDTFQTVNDIEIHTYHLLRYIDPGGEDLDSFPVPWEADVDTDNPGWTFQDIVQGIVNTVVFETNCADPVCEEEAEKATKRELWIRMLAGGDDEVSSAWDDVRILGDLDALDFVVAENIRHISIVPAFLTDTVDNDGDGDVDGQDTDEHLVDAAGFPEIREPSIDTADFDPTRGRVPFFTYREFGTRNRTDANGVVFVINPITGVPVTDPITGEQIPQTETVPIELRYWNDTRNIELVLEKLQSFPPGEVIELNLGSPLDARLPVEIGLNFTLFFPSPYPGAPDFNRTFTQRIDIPTGYRRAFTTPP